MTASHIPVSSVPPLTVDMLMNGTYRLPEISQPVTLVKGIYEDDRDYIRLIKIAFGDLDGDGVQDAVLVFADSWIGGTGTGMAFMAVLNRGGIPEQNAMEGIGDRSPVYKLRIQQGRIVLDAALRTWYPSGQYFVPVVMTYQLFNKSLFLTRFTSKTVDKKERAIRITSPANGTTVSCSVQVSGTLSIAPFKNFLDYRIRDLNGNTLVEGSFPVEPKDADGLLTFDISIDLAGVPAGKAIRLEILDANEEYYDVILMMDSIDLISE